MTARGRPGTKNIWLKLFLCLVVVGLLPIAALLLTMRSIEKQRARTGEVHHELLTKCQDLYHSNLNLSKKLQASQTKQTQMTQLINAHIALHKMVSNLTSLISGKDKDSLVTDTKILSVMQSNHHFFAEAALLHPASENVLLLGSNHPGGPIKQILPKLYKQRSSGPNQALSLSSSGWYWLQLGNTEYQLAVRMPKPEAPASSQEKRTSPLDLDRLKAGANLSDKDLAVLQPTTTLGFALLGLLLAGVAFLWIRTRMLLPLDRITRDTRKLLENPSEPVLDLYRSAGFLEDLSNNLALLQDRATRLEELDTRLNDAQRASTHICDVLDQVSKGRLGTRVVVRPGECEEIAAATNRMLDVLAEKLKAFHQASQHLQTSANHLQELSKQFSHAVLSSDTEQPPIDLGLAGGLLGVEIDDLCHQTRALINDLTGKPMIQNAPNDQEMHVSPLASATGGLRLLAQQTQEIRSSIERISRLHQETELLTTNLAIATEARSWTQLERLVEKTRTLSKKLNNLFDSLSRDLKELALMGRTLEEITRKATDLYNRRTKQLQAWEDLQKTWQHRKEALVHQIEVVRPAAHSLDKKLNQLSTDTMRYRSSLLQGQKIMQQIGQTAAALATAADEIVLQAKKMEIDKPVPAAWTHGLAESQRTLERAIRELTEIATQEGIEVLKTDTQAILDNIRSAAEQAQHRLFHISEQGDASESTRPETGV